jgi:hypothetical protein
VAVISGRGATHFVLWSEERQELRRGQDDETEALEASKTSDRRSAVGSRSIPEKSSATRCELCKRSGLQPSLPHHNDIPRRVTAT